MARSAGTAALGVVLLLCGAAVDSPSLNVPGVVLLALGAGAGLWVLFADRGAFASREPGPATVLEDEPYPLRLRFAAGLLVPPAGELVEPLLPDPLPIGRRRARRARVDVRFSRRGRRTIEPARLTIRDPLWLSVRERAVGEPHEVTVLPRVEPVLLDEAAGRSGAMGDVGRPLRAAAGAELELDSLRPYREGTPASRIHWPTVARAGELVERRLVGEDDARPVTVLDARRPESEEALDRAVRAAASLTVWLARSGGCGLLLPGERRPAELDEHLHGWASLHVRLALAQAVEEPPRTDRLQRAGAVFWVVAAAGGRVPAGLERAAVPIRFLVTAGEAPGVPAFTVAGCTGFRLGRARRAAA